MTPEQHAQAIEDALEKYLQEIKDFGYVNHSYLLPKLQAPQTIAYRLSASVHLK